MNKYEKLFKPETQLSLLYDDMNEVIEQIHYILDIECNTEKISTQYWKVVQAFTKMEKIKDRYYFLYQLNNASKHEKNIFKNEVQNNENN